jgi:hypothetical protein
MFFGIEPLALTAKLMKAVDMSGINTHVVNASFPDVTNASLARIGLAPTIRNWKYGSDNSLH